MSKKNFYTLALGIILSFLNIDNSYAQRYEIVFSPPRPMSEWLPLQKSHIDRLTLSYWQKYLNAEKGQSAVYYLLSEIEVPVITRGSTTRVRYMFDNSVIAHIEVEGVCETTTKDIEKGVFDVMLSPEQTTLYKTNIHVKSADGSIVVLEGVANRRVIVIEGGRRELSAVITNIQHSKQRTGENRYADYYRYLNSIAGDVPEALWVYLPERLNEQLGIIAGKNNVLPNDTIIDVKAKLKKSTERFDNLKWSPDINSVLTTVEHRLIARGDSTRIKFLFDRRRVRSIKVLGYGKASRDDLSKGEYVVTVAPKNTKLIQCYINGNERVHKRIIVIDPEKYEEVMRKFYSLQGSARRQYLNKLAVGVPEFAF